MSIQEQELGQARESTTNAVSVYSPSASETGIIKSIVLCNNTGSAITFSIFKDNDGTTYDQTTAHFYDAPLGANSTIMIDTYWPMNNSSGNLAYSTSAGSSLTITVYGAVITV